ncbi:MAG: hypothetical protein B0D92_07840 [Spirochaeta sp. LUC14_002_19_P3]|nr:MAG: hypothetical protein B0D92_07840 [Spirochaeta sp. LUC14_002_19_P3]
MDQITAHHKKEYGVEPSVICSAPGKIDLLGEHGEFGQGYVISLAIDRRFYVAMSRRKDNTLCFYSENLQERRKITISGLRYRREDRWANYPKGVIDGLIHMGFKLKGLNITLFSDVPIGIGLASSSAMTIASVCALKELFHLDLSDSQIIEAARLAENKFMGLYNGTHSPMVTYFSKKNYFTFIDLKTRSVKYLPLPDKPVCFAVTDSRVVEAMSDEEKKAIDAACRECSEALGLSQAGKIFRSLKHDDLAGTIDGLSERSRRMSLHLITENERIEEFRKALKGKVFESLGRIITQSHESLRDYLEISCPEIDWLIKRSIEIERVYGSRMIGPGYGGCILTLMDGDARNEYEECLEEYDRIFGFKASVFLVETEAGALVHLTDAN